MDRRRPVTAVSSDQVASRLAALHRRIEAAGGDLDRIRVCAVTKGFGVDAIRAAAEVGLQDIGENYAQELIAKRHDLDDDPSVAHLRWHMIGRLQRNKIRPLAPWVHLWQSVDRIEVARTIAQHAPAAEVLLQVNATGETGKGGFGPTELSSAVDELRALGLDVRGVMTVGPTDTTVDPAAAFQLAAALAHELELPELSMGMSGDIETAVAAGSTMVRVGTALFGPRPPRATASGALGG